MRFRRDRRPDWAREVEAEAAAWQRARALAGLCPVRMRTPGAISSFWPCGLGIGHLGSHRDADAKVEITFTSDQAVESWHGLASEWWGKNVGPDGEPIWRGADPP